MERYTAAPAVAAGTCACTSQGMQYKRLSGRSLMYCVPARGHQRTEGRGYGSEEL